MSVVCYLLSLLLLVLKCAAIVVAVNCLFLSVDVGVALGVVVDGVVICRGCCRVLLL